MGSFVSAVLDREFANFQANVLSLHRRALLSLLAFTCAVLPISLAQSQESLCAEVKIEINQKVSLERQAFDAVMRINNGLDLSALTNISVNLKFTNSAGAAVVATTDPNSTTALFFLRLDSLAGVGAVDGTGVVAPKTSGEIKWLIIPAAGTGGTSAAGQIYYVGGTLTYTLEGDTKTVEVTPVAIQVKPQPLLVLDYFLAGDVYADDAFTPATEPAEPFTLGVRVKNTGGGVASKLKIESAQPKIIDNQQGLQINFQITNGYVNDVLSDKTLLLNFGDIAASTAKVGRWDMVTTLSGRFTELSATFTHDDTLGGALTSLIQQVNTHILVHDVKVDIAGRDNIRDFLAKDGDTLRLYQSEGDDSAVTDHSASASLTAATAGRYRLRFTASPGFAYVKLPDPNAGKFPPGRMTRSDGKVVPAENVWLSKKRNVDLTYSYFVNFFDANSTGDYDVELVPVGQLSSIAGTVFIDVNENGVKDTGEAGLAVARIDLTGKDSANIDVLATANTDSAGNFVFNLLKPGTYTVKVGAVSSYVDGTSTAGTAGGTVSAATVSGVILTAGSAATGYTFAKRAAIPNQADLSVTHTVNASVVALNAQANFTIKVKNIGPAVATATTVSYSIPAGLNVVSASASQGSYDKVAGSWAVGNLAKDQEATLTVVTRVDIYKAYTLMATAGSTTPDPNMANNAANVALNAIAQNQSDIRVTASASAGLAPINAAVTYVVSAANFGPDMAQGLTIANTLPANVSLTSAVPSQGTYAAGNWQIDTLPIGAAAYLTVTGVLVDANPAAMTASVTALQSTDPVSTNNNAALTINGVNPQADLRVAIATDTTAVAAGAPAQLTYKVTNAGPATATSVSVKTGIGNGLSYVSSAPDVGVYDAATTSWGIPSIEPGKTVTMTLIVNALSTTAATVVTGVQSATSDPNLSDNEARLVLNGQLPGADLRVTVTPDRLRVTNGQPLGLKLIVANTSAVASTQVAVVNRIPAGTTLTTTTTSAGSYDVATGLWTIGDLAANASVTLDLSLMVSSSGPIRNTATVISNQLDADFSNNISHLLIAGAVADIAMSISASQTNPVVGESVTITATARNLGPDAAEGLTVNAPIPSTLSAATASVNGGTYNPATGVWTIGHLDANAEAKLTIAASVSGISPVSVTATVASTASNDTNAANDSATVTLSGVLQADLSATLSGPVTVNAGDRATYQIGVRNGGPSSADGSSIRFELPATLSAIELTCAVVSGAALCPTGLGVAANQTITITSLPTQGELRFTASGIAPPSGQLTAKVFTSVVSGVTDPNVNNNAPAPVVTQIRAANLTSTLAVDKQSYGPFDTVGIVSVVNNQTDSIPLANLKLIAKITDSAGTVVFSEERSISSLATGASSNFALSWPINKSPAGTYRVDQQAVNADGLVLDTRTVNFAVESTADTGAGITGALAATPSEITQGDSTSFAATLTNAGNADIANAPINITIKDEAQFVVQQFAFTRSLNRSGITAIDQVWLVPVSRTPGTYSVSLTVLLGGRTMPLAQTSIVVKAIPIKLMATLVLDKASYVPSDVVNITAHIANDIVSSTVSNALVTQQITGPTGTIVFAGQQPIVQLLTGASVDQTYSWPINKAVPGTYTVRQQVVDSARAVLDTKAITFVVQSTADTGFGVTGTLVPSAAEVAQGSLVMLNATISNAGNADASMVPIKITIADAAGTQVQQFTSVQSLSRNAPTLFNTPWTVPMARTPGTYSIAIVATFGATSVTLAQNTIIVKAAPVKITSTVVVNKISYAPSDTVDITAHVANDAISSPVVNAVVIQKITGPTNAVVFSAQQSIGQLAVGTSVNQTYSWLINKDAPGIYAVTQVVQDANGAVLDTRTASFTVQSTADTGFGVSGVVTASPNVVQQTDSVILSATITNVGNVDVAGAPVKISVIDANQQVIVSFDSTVNLNRTTPISIAQTWAIPAALAPGDYVVKVDVTLGGTSIKLAETSLKVKLLFKVAVTSALTAQSRVLVLVSCQAAGQGANGGQDEPFCLTARKNFIGQYLTGLGVIHKVTSSSDEFRDLMRCGDYNTYWIAGGANKLKDQLAEEVREAVLRGDALIVDGAHDNRNKVFNDVTGIEVTGNQGNIATGVNFNGALGTGSAPASGSYLKIKLDAGITVQATFANGDAAVVTSNYANGKALFFAYDLLATLQANDGSQALKTMLGSALAIIRPSVSAEGARSSLAPISVRLQNNGPAAVAQLDISIPVGASASNAVPAATTIAADKLSWRVSLAAGEIRTFTVDLRLPAAAGVNNAEVKLFRVEVPPASPLLTEISSQTVSMAVVVGEQIKGPLVSELGALTLNGGDRNARDKAVEFINSAFSNAGQNKTSEAIADYLAASDQLDKIAVPNPTIYQVRIARLMQDAGKLGCAQIALSCSAANWGPVGYGALVFAGGNMTNADSQGAVAVGGTLSLSATRIASKIAGDSALLAVAGNLTFNNGNVGLNGSGIIRVGGTANVNPNISHRDLQSGVATEDFTSLKSWYVQLSDKVAQLPGAPAVADGAGKFTLTGVDLVRNVFTMTDGALSQARSIVFDVPDNSTVILNITGAAPTFSNGQSFWGAQSMQDHARAGQILYNFPQATNVTLTGFSPQGTILAPRANLTHQSNHINGQVVVNGLTASGALHCGGGFVGSLPASTLPVQ